MRDRSMSKVDRPGSKSVSLRGADVRVSISEQEEVLDTLRSQHKLSALIWRSWIAGLSLLLIILCVFRLAVKVWPRLSNARGQLLGVAAGAAQRHSKLSAAAACRGCRPRVRPRCFTNHPIPPPASNSLWRFSRSAGHPFLDGPRTGSHVNLVAAYGCRSHGLDGTALDPERSRGAARAAETEIRFPGCLRKRVEKKKCFSRH
jgi:hypothetical protein